MPGLPQTRAMLSRACDTRLPARLSLQDCDAVAAVLVKAAQRVMQPLRAFGT
jgi:hypothetical protein